LENVIRLRRGHNNGGIGWRHRIREFIGFSASEK